MADLMDKIDIIKLKEVLEEKEMKFTIADINALMDSELEKPPEEMNTDLVDLCADVLNKAYKMHEESKNVPAKRKVKVSKIMLVAAVVALLCVVAIPVGARFMPGEAADAIVDFCYDHFKIDLRGEPKTTEASSDNNLVNNLILESLHTLKLPEALLGDEYEKSARMQEAENINIILVDIFNQETKIDGTIIITQYIDENVEIANGVSNVTDNWNYFKQLSIDGTDIVVFGDKDKSYINYIDGNTEYQITLICDFDTAVKIAESIK